jgi:hypothetical protein
VSSGAFGDLRPAIRPAELHERVSLQFRRTPVSRSSSRCAMPRLGRLLHHNVVSLLQVSDEVIRHELSHQIIAVSEPAATVALKGKAQRKPKFIRIGGMQVGGLIDHADRLDQPGERIKNIIAEVSCGTASRSAIVTACQTVHFQPLRHSSAEFSAWPLADRTRYTSSPRPSP